MIADEADLSTEDVRKALYSMEGRGLVFSILDPKRSRRAYTLP